MTMVQTVRTSFAHKITCTVLLASAVAVVTLLTALLIFDNISSRSLLQNRLSTLADVVEQNSEPALEFDDRRDAGEVLQGLRAETAVVSACLYDASGKLFAQYHRLPAPENCASSFAGVPRFTHNSPGTIRSIVHGSDLVGTLLLRADLQDIEGRRQRLLWVAGWLAVLALAGASVAGTFLQRTLSKPIFELVYAMRDVSAKQDFAVRVPISGSDEIAQLGRGFNSMLAELDRRNKENKTFEAKLQYQASNDALTGLPNRRLFADRLGQTLALAGREKRIVALLYIDLDGFKLVNDSLGHPIGDALLVQVAGRLRSRVRQSDTLARLGGDEFTVILTALHARSEAELVANSLLEAVAPPFLIGDHQLTIGASIGISVFPDDAEQPHDLTQQADSAMYAAKRNGKNRAMFFNAELGSLVRERLNLETQLRGAVARGEITVQYQPEFDAVTSRLIRFEALARWTHPTLGSISPDKFIPIAEEGGLIVSLGAYIMERACAEAVKWQSLTPYPVQVAVNVSSIQFSRTQFVEEVTEILKHTGLPPDLLQLELTESVMLTGVHRSAATMHELRKLGVSLAIDDFGTGYSCLSYLPVLPFDALKIDRSFVRAIDSRPENEAMVHSLVTLAHNIGMRVIVEGIERQDQLDLIRKFGGNEIQGYLMGRPTSDPCSHIAELLRKGSSDAEVNLQE
jgi:diguanylate cyclase (GGDEF)-like protein